VIERILSVGHRRFAHCYHVDWGGRILLDSSVRNGRGMVMRLLRSPFRSLSLCSKACIALVVPMVVGKEEGELWVLEIGGGEVR
jgi:hypothetical protein